MQELLWIRQLQTRMQIRLISITSLSVVKTTGMFFNLAKRMFVFSSLVEENVSFYIKLSLKRNSS
jgi:hypothetical protein